MAETIDMTVFGDRLPNYTISCFVYNMKYKNKDYPIISSDVEINKTTSSRDENEHLYKILGCKLSVIPNVFKKNEKKDLFEKIFIYKDLKSLQEFEKNKKEFIELYNTGLAFPSWLLLDSNLDEIASLGCFPKDDSLESNLIILQSNSKIREEDWVAKNTPVIAKGGYYLFISGSVEYKGQQNVLFNFRTDM
jgi:hypothetical protein